MSSLSWTDLTLCLWFPGAPCLAEYSDGKYYRAKLLKVTSVEPVMILVQHVDFGSDDTLPSSKYERYTQQFIEQSGRFEFSFSV